MRVLLLIGVCVLMTGCAQAKQAVNSVAPATAAPEAIMRSVDSAGVSTKIRPDTTETQRP